MQDGQAACDVDRVEVLLAHCCRTPLCMDAQWRLVQVRFLMDVEAEWQVQRWAWKVQAGVIWVELVLVAYGMWAMSAWVGLQACQEEETRAREALEACQEEGRKAQQHRILR